VEKHKSKKLNAVEMVRKIRTELSAELKNATEEEILAFFKSAGEKAAEITKLPKKRSVKSRRRVCGRHDKSLV